MWTGACVFVRVLEFPELGLQTVLSWHVVGIELGPLKEQPVLLTTKLSSTPYSYTL